ncbi:growth inhibitor [Desulfosporosinus acidiphilus SJ4]|uniref:mRNA interferase n=1 Tax=Desulfosporosinus acidiphilus (strain DSM 22704 / JCM 16185 / SJ4) TaxID=646529 RepID=I4D9H8_DESAJ|nr:endoribonuclease MazF [Desulfosporosinus acidiphilus]AFM42452.1 growth inhibitor [Desulfosporosinus acidiphilus SJ4]
MVSQYVPERGDIVWIQLNPQLGHEQQGTRPALVLSAKEYNSKTGMGIFCPITSRVKGFPFEVKLPEKLEIRGVVLADQIKSLDWRSRNASFICKVAEEIMEEVILKLEAIIK